MIYLKKIFSYNLVFLVSLIICSAEARWSKYEDAPIEFKFFNNDININKDGTSHFIREMQVKIIKESGRSYFTQYNLTYNDDCAKIEILEAKTIYNGQEYIVTKDMIEDKPLASFGQGFDQLNQISISFPKAELGAEIYLKYKYTVTKIPLDEFYGYTLFFGGDGYWQASHVKINSQLPLNIKVNDPKGVLEVIKDAEYDFHSAEIILKKPIYEALTNEPANGVLDVKHNTWVSLSSLTKWQDLAKRLAGGYYDVINQTLPDIFIDIAKSANDKNTDEEKINFVTSTLNEKIQYMGDWRSVSGRYFPRDLAKIINSQIGDCKDFTASTAAILQKIGYKVQPILVMRGVTNFSNPNSLPNIENFNHVMLKITNKEGKIYWVDPTNMVSMAQGVFPDIANKMALLLDSKSTGYIKITDIKPQDSRVILRNELVINNNLLDSAGEIILKGVSALNVAGAGLYSSDEQIRDFIFFTLSGVYLDQKEKKLLELPDLTSRIVKDLVIKYEFQQKNQTFKTNLGRALTLKSAWIDEVINTAPDQITDIFISVPITRESHLFFKDIIIKDCKKLNFATDSPWVYVNRSCKYQNDGTEFTDIISVKKSFITNEELKTNQYKTLKNDLENNFNKATVILSD